jgi:hypothetical protein
MSFVHTQLIYPYPTSNPTLLPRVRVHAVIDGTILFYLSK